MTGHTDSTDMTDSTDNTDDTDRSDQARACGFCAGAMNRPAPDTCTDRVHRSTDATLGLRDAACGCCSIVDMVALNLLRNLTEPARH